MHKPYKYILPLSALISLCSCSTVKSYQKQFLNDHYMQQGPMAVEKLESEATSYREGASGGETGRTGGGCGCN